MVSYHHICPYYVCWIQVPVCWSCPLSSVQPLLSSSVLKQIWASFEGGFRHILNYEEWLVFCSIIWRSFMIFSSLDYCRLRNVFRSLRDLKWNYLQFSWVLVSTFSYLLSANVSLDKKTIVWDFLSWEEFLSKDF